MKIEVTLINASPKVDALHPKWRASRWSPTWEVDTVNQAVAVVVDGLRLAQSAYVLANFYQRQRGYPLVGFKSWRFFRGATPASIAGDLLRRLDERGLEVRP